MASRYHSAMRMERPTVRTIAKRLHLSPATVSRSLRGHPDIGQETRTRILEAAQAVGYSPRKYIRSSPGTRPVRNMRVLMLVGCLCGLDTFGRLDSSFIGYHCVTATTRAADNRRGSASPIFMDQKKLWSPDVFTPLPEGIEDQLYDGVILVYPFPESFAAQVVKYVPVISIEHTYTTAGVDTISPTQSRDTTRAVEQLVALGHRSIGYVSDVNVGANRATQSLRYAGYLTGLDRAGIAFNPEYVIGYPHKPYTTAMLPEIVKQLWFKGVSAFVCSIDRHAYLLWREMPRLGIEVPEDLSLVGVNGVTPMHDLPQRATYRMPYETIAAAALERIAYRRKYPGSANMYVEYLSEPIAGESTAAPGETVLKRKRAE